MPGARFCHYQLRTGDREAARAFYLDVLGQDIWGPDTSLAPIPERAAARGVPAHWLGHLGVPDIEDTARRMVSLGGERLGPTQQPPGGSPSAALRDPFGAVLALCPETAPLRPSPVAWHVLHTSDHTKAFKTYSDLFGWSPAELLDLGPDLGPHRVFAWDPAAPAAGSFTSDARSPQTHPHWLFCFRVPDLASALDRVLALGGEALPPASPPNGALIAGCEDPQRGAFALYQPPPGAR